MDNLMKFCAALLIAFLGATQAFGTIIVLNFTPTRIIIVADSRERADRDSDPDNDDGCKVVQLDSRNFFFATGHMIDDLYVGQSSTVIWSGVDFSRQAFKASSQIKDRYTIVRAAANWAELMREAYERNWSHYNYPPGAGLGQGFFGTSESNEIRVYSSWLIYGKAPFGTKPTIIIGDHKLMPQTDLYEFGVPDGQTLVNEFLADKTPRAKVLNAKFRAIFPDPTSENYVAERLRRAVQAAIEWISDKRNIGGHIDVMILKRGQAIRWISRKKECADADREAQK